MVQLLTLRQLPLNLVRAFVFQNEVFSVQLAERLEQYVSQPEVRMSARDFFCLTEDNTLWGVIFASRAGLILPCIPQNLPESVFQAAIPLIGECFRERKVYCVSGWERGARLVRDSLDRLAAGQRSARELRNYHFMCYDSRRCRRERICPQSVVQCGPDDLEALYPLQSNYDTVEVLPKHESFKPELCRSNLRRVLALGNVFAVVDSEVQDGGRDFMAKANVSALARRFLLVGGVYTAEEHRRKGCAARLVQFLGDEAAARQKQAVLFVRQENPAARHAYENAGYFVSGNYEIAYYSG